MSLNTQSLIELIVGMIGIISAAVGLSAWATSWQIRHEITHVLLNLKQDSIVLRRRVKLMEQFAIKNGFQGEISTARSSEDTDL